MNSIGWPQKPRSILAFFTPYCLPFNKERELKSHTHARLFVKMSSTLRMAQQAFDSCRPQLVARWKSVRYWRQYSRVSKTWSSTDNFGGRPVLRRPPSQPLGNEFDHASECFRFYPAVALEICGA